MKKVSNEYLNAAHAVGGLLASETKKFEGIDIDPELALLAVDYLVFSAQEKDKAEIKDIDIKNMDERTRFLVKGALQAALSYKAVKNIVDKVTNGEELTNDDGDGLINILSDAVATEAFNDQRDGDKDEQERTETQERP